MTMKKGMYYILLSISISGIALFAFGIFNTMVSLKYETDNIDDCISQVNGQDLCLTVNILTGLTIFCGLLSILLIIFRNRIIKK